MTIGPEAPEGRRVKRPLEEDDQGLQARPAKKAKMDIQGTLRTIQQIASSGHVEAPELASTIQFLAKNLASIPQENMKSLKQDIISIKDGLEGSSGDTKEVVKEINDLLKIVRKGAKRPREEEALEEPEAKRARQESPTTIPGLPEEIAHEIALFLPKEEVFKLQAVSRGFSEQTDVVKARKEFADTIARKAILGMQEQNKPFSALKDVLTDATRNAVRSLNLSRIRLTADDLGTFAELFPNVTALDLSSTDITNDHLQQLHNFKSLQNLNLQGCNLKDESLQYLSGLDQLQTVDLSFNSALTGSTFDRLPPSLLELEASGCAITDENVAKLFRLDRLQKVDLSDNDALTGSTFDQLPPSLLELYASRCALTDENVALLSRLDRLQRVNLSENSALTGSTFDQLPLSLLELRASVCAITDENALLLSRLDGLQRVNLSGNHTLTGSTFDQLPLSLLELGASVCAITDENVALLSRLVLLQKVDLSENSALTGSTFDQLPLSLLELYATLCAITDDNVSKLYRLDRLKTVYLNENRALTDNARNLLKRALPNLVIV